MHNEVLRDAARRRRPAVSAVQVHLDLQMAAVKPLSRLPPSASRSLILPTASTAVDIPMRSVASGIEGWTTPPSAPQQNGTFSNSSRSRAGTTQRRRGRALNARHPGWNPSLVVHTRDSTKPPGCKPGASLAGEHQLVLAVSARRRCALSVTSSTVAKNWVSSVRWSR